MRESSDNHPIIIRYFPGIIRFTQVKFRFTPIALKANRPKIDRRNPGIGRSGCRYRSIESSDNRQMIYGNRQIAPLLHRRNVSPNRKLIVNQFPVIENSTALNPSRIHQSRARIHQFASEGSTSALTPQSLDRHPKIHPSDPAPMNSQVSATLPHRIRNRTARPLVRSIRRMRPNLTPSRVTGKNLTSSPLTVQPAGRGAVPSERLLLLHGIGASRPV